MNVLQYSRVTKKAIKSFVLKRIEAKEVKNVVHYFYYNYHYGWTEKALGSENGND